MTSAGTIDALTTGTAAPSLDLFENEKVYHVVVDAPGAIAPNTHLTWDDVDTLVVHVRRPKPTFSTYRRSRWNGSCCAGPVDQLYFDRVLEAALLSHAEESALAQRWRRFGDQAARNLLIQAHLRLVPPIARRYYRPGASLSELVAEGNFGLLRASAKFEPERGYRFATYARYWIRACVSECATRNSGAAMSLPRALRKVRREHARATNLVGEGVEVKAIIAERLQMHPEIVDDLVGLLDRRQVSFESLHSERRTDEPLYAREASPEQAMVNKTERQLLAEAVRTALASLNARERRIVDRRLMADAEAMLTLKELGREFGVSRERVRQLEANTKRKLETHFRALSKAVEVRAPKVAA